MDPQTLKLASSESKNGQLDKGFFHTNGSKDHFDNENNPRDFR